MRPSAPMPAASLLPAFPCRADEATGNLCLGRGYLQSEAYRQQKLNWPRRRSKALASHQSSRAVPQTSEPPTSASRFWLMHTRGGEGFDHLVCNSACHDILLKIGCMVSLAIVGAAHRPRGGGPAGVEAA